MDRRYRWKLKRYIHVEQPCGYHRFTWSADEELRRELRAESQIETALQNLDTEWKQIEYIASWVTGLSAHQGWDSAPDLSGLQLLRSARDGSVTFRCVEFAHMFQQTCAAFGIPARVISLRRPGSDDGLGKSHVVADVWSNEHQKWVVIDTQLNTTFVDRNGRLLSAVEVHDRVRQHQHDDLFMTKEDELRGSHATVEAKDNMKYQDFEVPEGFERDEMWDMLPERGDFDGFRHYWLEYYYQLVYPTSYGLLRETSVSGVDTGSEVFFYESNDLPPIAFQRMRQANTFTSDRSKIDFPLNGVEVQWIPFQGSESSTLEEIRTVRFHLRHSMPWFSHYTVVMNGEEIVVEGDEFEVQLHEGENLIEITPINDCGRIGSRATVVIHVA